MNQNVVGMVTNPPFGNSDTQLSLDQTGVGENLDAIAFPGLGFVVFIPVAAPLFMLIGDSLATSGTQGIYFAPQAQILIFQYELMPFIPFIFF